MDYYDMIFMNADGLEGGGEAGGEVQNDNPGETAETQPEKTFTQAQLDAIITERLSKAEGSFLKKVGFEDFEKGQNAIEEFKKYQESQMSEVEKAQKKAQEAETGKSELQKQLDATTLQLEALKKGIAPDNLEKVGRLMNAYDGETISDKLDALLADAPHLKGEQQEIKTATKGPDFSGPTQNKTHDETERLAKIAAQSVSASLGRLRRS